MIRLFIICISILALYLGFSAISQFDSPITVNGYDYVIQTSCFTFVVALIIVALLLLLCFKVLFLIFNLPFLIKARIRKIRERKALRSLIHAASCLITGEREKALKQLPKLQNIHPEYRNFYYLIMAELETHFEMKVSYLRQLITGSEYKYYASSRIARLFFDNELYAEALDYAVAAFNIKEDGEENLEILLHCYAKGGHSDKFRFVLSKFKNINLALTSQIADYYLVAAKSALEIGRETEALDYLEESLLRVPSNIAALDLFCSLKLSMGRREELPNILLGAFRANPSFEIAELYCRVSSESKHEILQKFKAAVPSKDHKGLFLAIEAYLDK